jgi:TPR repeat protein
LNHPSAENSLGICFERGIGVAPDIALATRYYQRSVAHGNPDGANNLGFCLEHGCGVKQNIHAAAQCDKFARDHVHPEGALNYRRCLRILGRWDGSDHSSHPSEWFSIDSDLARPFIDALDNPTSTYGASQELLSSIWRLKAQMAGPIDRPIVALDESSEIT